VLELWRSSAGADGAPIVENQHCRPSRSHIVRCEHLVPVSETLGHTRKRGLSRPSLALLRRQRVRPSKSLTDPARQRPTTESFAIGGDEAGQGMAREVPRSGPATRERLGRALGAESQEEPVAVYATTHVARDHECQPAETSVARSHPDGTSGELARGLRASRRRPSPLLRQCPRQPEVGEHARVRKAGDRGDAVAA
jgi:hypothetical protein